ncbi:hypothetical protein, partial [Nonomuraea rubra]|uniref:hypothetical protein n=1 Tax=Nonomuraea rubra TaxID=46180 RepID=UPI0031EF6335
MVPRLFEAEGVGRLLRDDRELGAALASCRRRPDQARRVLDGCRTAFLRGGEAADLRFFITLHDLPTRPPRRSAPHVRDYAAMLALPRPTSPTWRYGSSALKATPPAEAVESLLFPLGRQARNGRVALLDRVLKEPSEDVDAYAPALPPRWCASRPRPGDRAVKLAV